jgi:alkyl hydroperoxide reductase subunit AhpC
MSRTRLLFISSIALVPALALVMVALSPSARASALIGQQAPAFKLPDTNGKTVSLADFKGKFVVLEWVNFECPFVGKHYGSGNMQKLQKAYTGKGVTWISINSSAPGKEGHVDAAAANALVKQKGASPTEFLLDGPGAAGRAYGVKTTPHMFVIDPKGVLLYNGAIDDRPSTDQADISVAKNYVATALDEALAGKPVTTSSSVPYGCAVKY